MHGYHLEWNTFLLLLCVLPIVQIEGVITRFSGEIGRGGGGGQRPARRGDEYTKQVGPTCI